MRLCLDGGIGTFGEKSCHSESDPIPDIPLSDYKRGMHVIGKHNFEEAGDAIRDILMMYVDLADGTAGFGHNADVYVRFDPFKFVDAEAKEDGYYYVDLELLRAGSAVAILCALYNVWTEEQKLEGHPLTERFQAAIGAGRLSRFPDIEGVIIEAIRRNCALIEDQWMDDAVRPIYRKYVIGYFARLAKRDRSEPAT